MKRLLCIIFILIFSNISFGEEIINETTVKDNTQDGTRFEMSGDKIFYKLLDGTYKRKNLNFYQRQSPTVEGYSKGIWTNDDIIVMPDSLNDDLWFKIYNRFDDLFLAIKPVGIFRHWGGNIDTVNFIKFKNVFNGTVTTNGNSIKFPFGDSSYVKFIFDGQALKQEVYFSTSDRRAIIKFVPNANYIGIGYRYEFFGNKYSIDVNNGTAWTADSTFYQVYDVKQTFNDKKYWVSGVTKAAFWDTLNHPGAFVIDPTISLNYKTGASTYFSVNHSDWNTARNATSAGNISSYFYTGLEYYSPSTNYYVLRTKLTFDPDTSGFTDTFYSLQNCSLSVTYYSDNSPTDFIFTLYEGLAHGANANDQFNDFQGWAASGAYSSYALSDSFNSSGYVLDKEIRFCLNDSGRKYVTNKILAGDSICFYIISLEDRNNSIPTNAENVGFYGTNNATKYPKLIINALLFSNVYLPNSLAWSAITDTGATLDSVVGNPLDESLSNLFAFRDSSTNYWMDTSVVYPFSSTIKWYVKSAWKNKKWNFPSNYSNIFRVYVTDYKGDSLKTSLIDTLTIGTLPTDGDAYNQGRWNPAKDKIQ